MLINLMTEVSKCVHQRSSYWTPLVKQCKIHGWKVQCKRIITVIQANFLMFAHYCSVKHSVDHGRTQCGDFNCNLDLLKDATTAKDLSVLAKILFPRVGTEILKMIRGIFLLNCSNSALAERTPNSAQRRTAARCIHFRIQRESLIFLRTEWKDCLGPRLEPRRSGFNSWICQRLYVT